MIRQKGLAERVFESQGWRCAYCGERMYAPSHIQDGGPPLNTRERRLRRATVDHIIPKKHGGTDAIENLVAACNECNSKRGHADAMEWWTENAG